MKPKEKITLTNVEPASPVWSVLRADVSHLYRLPWGLQEFLSGRVTSVVCTRADEEQLFVLCAAAMRVVTERGELKPNSPYDIQVAPTPPTDDPTNDRILACRRLGALLHKIGMTPSENDIVRHIKGKYYGLVLQDGTPQAKRLKHRSYGWIRLYSAEYISVHYRSDEGDTAKVFESVENCLLYLVAVFHVADESKANAVPVRQPKGKATDPYAD